jgi:GDP-L-fucose synthase
VGGIKANIDFKADFIYDNLMIQSNIIKSSKDFDVKKLIFLGSSCIYPKMSIQPIKEEYLLTGELESSNDAYAISKIAGIKMCQSYNHQYETNFISVMPTNLFGENDNYDLNNSHVLPAMIRKFHESKTQNKESVEIWGTGNPKREFLYVDDLADACVFLMNNYDGSEIVNIGTGKDLSIKELAYLVKDIVGFNGKIIFNSNMPDGTPRKLLDVSKLNKIGWKYKTSLREGIEKTYKEKYAK